MSWNPDAHRALTFGRLKEFLLQNALEGDSELKVTRNPSLCLRKDFFTSTNFKYISNGTTRGIIVHQYTVPDQSEDLPGTEYDNDLIVVEPDILYIIPPEPVSYTVLLRAGLGVNGNSSSSYIEISSTQVSEGGTWEFPSNISANNNYKLRNIVYTDCEGVTLTINASDGVFSNLPTLTINCDLTIDINADRYYKVKIITRSGTKYNNADTGESGIEVILKKGTTWTSEAFSVDDPNNDLVVRLISGTSSKYSYDSSTNKVKITKIASDYVIESSTQAVTPTDELSIIKLVQEECFGVTLPVLGLDFEIHEGNQDISSLLTLSTDNTLDLLGEYRIVVIQDEEETDYHSNSYYLIQLYWNNEIVYLGSETDTCIVPYYNSPTFVKTAWQYDDIASDSSKTQVNVSSPFIGLPVDGLATITVSVNGGDVYPCYLAGITAFDGEWVTAPTQSRNLVIAVPQNHNGKAVKNYGAMTESVTTPDLMTISITTISPHTCQISLTNISSSINLYIWASSTLWWPEPPCTINTIEVRKTGGTGTLVLLVIERGDANFPDWLTEDKQDRGSNNSLSSFALLYIDNLTNAETAALNLMTTLLNSIPALNDLQFFYWYIKSSCDSDVEKWECDNCTLFLDFELDTPVPTIIYVSAKVKLASVNDCNETVDWSSITTYNEIVGTLNDSSLIIFNNLEFDNVCSADLYDSQGTLLLTHDGNWTTNDLATYLVDHTFEPGGHILANYEFRVKLLPTTPSCTYYDPNTIKLEGNNTNIIVVDGLIPIGSHSEPNVNHFEIQECTETNGSSTCGRFVDIFTNGTGINNNAITVNPLAYSGGSTATITFSDIKADCSGLGSSITKEFPVS